MKEILIDESKGFRSRAIKITDDIVQIITEYWHLSAKKWMLFGTKTITIDEYEALKKLFEGGEK